MAYRQPFQTPATGGANVWQTQPAGHAFHPLLTNDSHKFQKLCLGVQEPSYNQGIKLLLIWTRLSETQICLHLHLHQNQPSPLKLLVNVSKGQDLSEACDVVQVTVPTLENQCKPCSPLQKATFRSAFASQAIWVCLTLADTLQPLGETLTTEINGKALTSFSRTRISPYDFLLYKKKSSRDGAQLLTAQTSDTNNTFLLCPKLYLNCISGRFWDVWYRSPAITSDVVSFRTVEPDVKCERFKK